MAGRADKWRRRRRWGRGRVGVELCAALSELGGAAAELLPQPPLHPLHPPMPHPPQQRPPRTPHSSTANGMQRAHACGVKASPRTPPLVFLPPCCRSPAATISYERGGRRWSAAGVVEVRQRRHSAGPLRSSRAAVGVEAAQGQGEVQLPAPWQRGTGGRRRGMRHGADGQRCRHSRAAAAQEPEPVTPCSPSPPTCCEVDLVADSAPCVSSAQRTERRLALLLPPASGEGIGFAELDRLGHPQRSHLLIARCRAHHQPRADERLCPLMRAGACRLCCEQAGGLQRVSSALSGLLFHDLPTGRAVAAAVSAPSAAFTSQSLSSGSPSVESVSALVHASSPLALVDVQAEVQPVSGRVLSYAIRTALAGGARPFPRATVGLRLADRGELSRVTGGQQGGAVDGRGSGAVDGCSTAPVLSSTVLYQPFVDVQWKADVVSDEW